MYVRRSVDWKVLPALYKMSMLRIFFIFSVYLVTSVKANPCENSYSQAINICDMKSSTEDPYRHNVYIKADSKTNCTCELFISGHTSENDIIIGRYGNYTSSHPGSIGGCGVIIQFFVNNDRFYEASCSMYTIKRCVTVNQKIFIKSKTITGNLKSGSGYCIELINERSRGGNGTLHLTCGLQDQNLLTSPSQTSESVCKPTTTNTESISSTQIWMDSTESGNLENLWTYDKSVSTSSSLLKMSPSAYTFDDSPFPVATVVGVSVGCMFLLFLIVVFIFVMRKTKRCRTSKSASSEEQNVNEVNASEEDSEYGLKYNSLYNMGFQPKPHNGNTSEPSNESVKVNEEGSHEDNNGYRTIESAMEIRAPYKPTDQDEPYCIIEDYVNHKESQLDDNDVVRQPSFPEVECKTTDLHNDRVDYSEDKSNTDVYAVPDKRKIKHVITPSGCEYAMVNK